MSSSAPTKGTHQHAGHSEHSLEFFISNRCYGWRFTSAVDMAQGQQGAVNFCHLSTACHRDRPAYMQLPRTAFIELASSKRDMLVVWGSYLSIMWKWRLVEKLVICFLIVRCLILTGWRVLLSSEGCAEYLWKYVYASKILKLISHLALSIKLPN